MPLLWRPSRFHGSQLAEPRRKGVLSQRLGPRILLTEGTRAARRLRPLRRVKKEADVKVRQGIGPRMWPPWICLSPRRAPTKGPRRLPPSFPSFFSRVSCISFRGRVLPDSSLFSCASCISWSRTTRFFPLFVCFVYFVVAYCATHPSFRVFRVFRGRVLRDSSPHFVCFVYFVVAYCASPSFRVLRVFRGRVLRDSPLVSCASCISWSRTTR